MAAPQHVLLLLLLLLLLLGSSVSHSRGSSPPSIPSPASQPPIVKTWLSNLGNLAREGFGGGRGGRGGGATREAEQEAAARPDNNASSSAIDSVAEEEEKKKKQEEEEEEEEEASPPGGSHKKAPADWLCGLQGSFPRSEPTETFNRWAEALKLRMLDKVVRGMRGSSPKARKNATGDAESGSAGDGEGEEESGENGDEAESDSGLSASLGWLLGEQGWLSSLLSYAGNTSSATQILNTTVLGQWSKRMNMSDSLWANNITGSLSHRREVIKMRLGEAFDQAKLRLFGAWMDIEVDLQDWDLSLEELRVPGGGGGGGQGAAGGAADTGGEASAREGEQASSPFPEKHARQDHLYVLVHGLHGSTRHLGYLASRTRARLGERAYVHVAACNSGGMSYPHITHDGVDSGGERLAAEVAEVVRRHREENGGSLRFISFLGNSLGGLYCRYCIGRLYDRSTGLISGLIPWAFTTTASPHLSVKNLMPKMLEAIVTDGLWPTALGNTGKQLFLADGGGGDGVPLLLRMTRDDKIPFLSGLAAFRHRVLYGNICNDFLVKYETASISPTRAPHLDSAPAISDEFPHIISDTGSHVVKWPPDSSAAGEVPFYAGDPKASPIIEEMIRNLQALGWRRVGARFQRTVDGKRPLPFPLSVANAHNHLPVCRPLLDGKGADSVEHICGVWASQAAEIAQAGVYVENSS